MLAATCSAVGCKPDWIISAVSRSSPSTVMVFATTRPWSSDVPSTFTLSPDISTVLEKYCLSRPKSPLSSFVCVSSVRTTVVFPSPTSRSTFSGSGTDHSFDFGFVVAKSESRYQQGRCQQTYYRHSSVHKCLSFCP